MKKESAKKAFRKLVMNEINRMIKHEFQTDRRLMVFAFGIKNLLISQFDNLSAYYQAI